MKRFAVYGLATVGLLFVAAVAGMFSGSRAIAQTVIRAVLVKGIDEPGRSPYRSSVVFSRFPSPPSSVCLPSQPTSLICDLFFDVVPSGKRLVLQHVSAKARLAPTDMMHPLEILYQSPLPLPTGSVVRVGHVGPLSIDAPPAANAKLYGFDSPFTGYVDPLGQPFATIILNPGTGPGFTGLPDVVVTLTGHLVDLSQ